jgi:hypothetical protein
MADGDFSIPVPVWAENLPELADRFALGWSDYMYDDLPGYIRLLSTEQKWELCHAIDDRLISSNYEP